MKKYNVIIKQSRTGLVLADFTELSKTKKIPQNKVARENNVCKTKANGYYKPLYKLPRRTASV